jgi:poly(A) polymerase
MQNPKITTQIKQSINSKIKNQPFFAALKLLVTTLKDNKTYPRIVGGCVRDFILNKSPEDIDLATTLQPEEVIARIKEVNKTVIPTGLKHGTVTVIIDDYKFEVTTLRIDVKCDGRHAEVAFKKNFKLDAKRRDFTINAMSYCIMRGKLYDYFAGLEHLKIKKVIFIGDAEQRIKEDALRILRFFRFSSYYADEIDEIGFDSCIKNKNLLKNLSQERVTSEFNKILISKNMHILFSMREILMEINLAEINLEKLSSFITFLKNENKLKTNLNTKFNNELKNKLELIYAILFSEMQLPQAQLSKMRLPNIFIKKVQKMIWFEQEIINYKIGNNDENKNNKNEEDLILFLKLNYKSNENIYEEILLLTDFHLKIDKQKLMHLKEWLAKIPNFEITGEDIIKLGVTGSEIKKVLDNLYYEWIKSDCKATKNELLNRIPNF